MTRFSTTLVLIGALSAEPALAQQTVVNWETSHVQPMDISADGSRLFAVNTADGRLEVFDLTSGTPVPAGSIPVGIDPVSVRVRPGAPNEVWVVNQISDSVSVVDVLAGNVKATLVTDDEPADVVFAGSPQRAFVSCMQANTVLVFDPANLGGAPTTLSIAAEEPRSMAVSTNGSEVYVAVYRSGNGSTILAGGSTMGGGFPPNVVNHPAGPYGGTNPPPNDGASFDPPIAGGLPAPPAVGLIVKKNAAGQWLDDNSGNWTNLVSGAQAGLSGRPTGWDLPDRDVVVIDSGSLSVTYATRIMNVNAALAVNPATDQVTVVGTDATNEIRFEPVLTGTFLRVNLGIVDPSGPATTSVVDLNPHLTYTTGTIAQPLRDQSLGDPRGIVWNSSGTRAYVTGMGSNNVIVLDAAGNRAGAAPTIEVGEGPTGVVLDEGRNQLYVLNKFEGAVSVVSTSSELETSRVPFHDPTSAAVKIGRKHLYDTHRNSGLGQVACASCHVDARMDRLAWDLGDPSGSMKSVAGQNLGMGLPQLIGTFEDWHPMKGPMTTQTLQDIIGKEPHHWRGDRDGLEEFAGAFTGLQGDDAAPSGTEMAEFENFLATIHFPPNPFRNLDNSLPSNLPLPGHFTTGRFGPAGQPLPNGDAVNGLVLYRPPNLLDAVACATCHTLPTGAGSDHELASIFGPLVPIPPGPNEERHLALVSVDGSTNVSMKIPHLRNQYDKVGFEMTQTSNAAGFGFLHDGSIDSIARFLSEPVFSVTSDQDVADLVALMLAFSGSDLPTGGTTINDILEPLGPTSQDTHAAVGRQVTLDGSGTPPLLTALVALADAGAVGLVVKGVRAGETRGWTYLGGDVYQSDRSAETHGLAQLQAGAAAGSELTFTVVVSGTELRIGVDRDEDGYFDTDETDAGSDPADASSIPQPCTSGLPLAVTGLDATSVVANTVQLQWTDSNIEEDGYIVERSGPGRGGPFDVLDTLAPDSTGYTDVGLPCQELFTYRIRAFNCAGSATSSAAARVFCPSGFTGPLPTAPRTP